MFHERSTIGDLFERPEAAQYAQSLVKKIFNIDPADANTSATAGADLDKLFLSLPLGSLVSFSNGAFTTKMLHEFLDQLNAG